MSKETLGWLRKNLRIGFTDERGPAWWSDGDGMADGSHFPGEVPPEEVRRLLNVELIEADITATFELNGTKDFLKLDDRKAIVLVRDGEVIGAPGLFKSGYQPHGYNLWINDSMQDIVDSRLQTAAVGLLRKGGVAFHQVKLPDVYEVAGFQYTSYFTGGTSCDGTLASTWFTGVDAAVCDNTFEMARDGAQTRVTVKHTKHSPGRLGEVRNRLGLVLKAAEDFETFATDLLNTEVSDKEFLAWMDAMVPMPEAKTTKGGGPGRGFTMAENKRNELEDLYRKDPKVAPWAGTAFGILQLDNTWRTWNRIVRGSDGGRIERNLLNQVTGANADDDQKALDILADVQSRKLVFA